MKRIGFGIGFLAALQLAAQPVAPPAFEVASVKVDTSAFVPGVTGRAHGGPGTDDPGRFTYTQQRLKFLVMFAYGVMADQVLGPAWLDDVQSDSITITATMPPDTSKERFQLMMQNLLAERFHLRLHHETRDFPGYDLVVAPGGTKLKEWAPEANAGDTTEGPGRDPQGFPRLATGKPGSAVSFSMSTNGPARVSMVRGTYRQPIAEFASRLGGLVNTSNGLPAGVAQPRVTDKTGLAGVYEFKLEFAGTVVMPGAAAPPAPDAVAAASDPGADGPNLFSALEKQLGLKLVKAKSVPVDVLVIDHLDKVPTEN